MIKAIQQRVIIQSGGRIEVNSRELPDGAEAEVIILVKSEPMAKVISPLEALHALQASLHLTPQGAQIWIEDAHAERTAWGCRE